jgi:hypothetical protein
LTGGIYRAVREGARESGGSLSELAWSPSSLLPLRADPAGGSVQCSKSKQEVE